MIVNDLQRLRWKILDECLRDTTVEYFMGDNRKNNEDGITRNLHKYVQQRMREIKRDYRCSKRVLQNDIALFERRGGYLEPSFRRGHKRILRLRNLQWKNPLLKVSDALAPLTDALPTLRSLAKQEGPTELKLRLGPTLRDEYKDLTDDNAVLTLHVDLDINVRRLVFGYGKELEVLTPESLRAEIRQVVNELFKLYRKEQEPKKKKGEQLDMFGELFG